MLITAPQPYVQVASSTEINVMHICDPSGRNQSHVGRVRFPLRAEMHGRVHITDSCFIAFITSKICYLSYGQVSHMTYVFKYTKKAVFRSR